MPTVQVNVELSDRRYRAYAAEARNRGTSVERIVEQVVQGLLGELIQEERDGTDHLIIPS